LKYRAEIDGLRAIAVLPVVFFHAGFSQVSGGFVGVDVFFVISGFLITRILIDELDADRFSIVAFYERRARRILPALFVVAASCIPAAWLLLTPSEMKRFADSLAAVSVFSSNILFWRESGYFDTAAELKPLLHTWSLAVEEQFYVAYPAFLFVIYRKGRGFIVPTLLALFVASLFLAEFFVREKPSAAFYLIPTRGWELLLGAVCTLGLRREHGAGTRLDNVLSAAGLVMIGLAVFAFDESTPTPSLYTLIPTLGAGLVLLCAKPNTLAGSLLSWGPVVGIGLISYSTYLWHQPVLVFLRYATQGAFEAAARLAAIAATLGLGYASWRFVEAPFRKRRLVPSKWIAIVGVAGTAGIFSIGLAGHLSEGFRTLRPENPAFARDALLQQVRAERQRLIRAGVCHFDENLPIDTFIAAWNCRSDDEGLFDSRIGVFGDSHAADKVVALRENGVDVWQVTGAGCEVAPDFVKDDRKYCNDLFRLLESHLSALQGVIVANRFALHELSDAYIEALFGYWGQIGLPVVLFGPMPDFALQQQQYAADGIATVPPSFERGKKFQELIGRHVVPPNITIIKTSDYWCPGGECAVAANGKYLMTDEDHLSDLGAALLGKRLLKDPEVRAFLGM
jgi:peptidoglycan/LPS O-acetylase OafA/YrhL